MKYKTWFGASNVTSEFGIAHDRLLLLWAGWGGGGELTKRSNENLTLIIALSNQIKLNDCIIKSIID